MSQGPSPRPSWSIAERATVWFAGATALVVLTLGGYAAHEVRSSKRAQVEALAVEKLAELRSRFDPAEALESAAESGRTFGQRAPQFEQLVTALRASLPLNPLAARVLDPLTGKPLGQFGAVELLGELPDDLGSGLPQWLEGERVACAERLSSDVLVQFVVSGRTQHREWQRFLIVSIVLALVSGAGAWFAGRHFVRRACGYMADLARRTRAVRDSSEAVEIEAGTVPEEIEELVRALEGMLARIRAEQERTRLMTSGLAHELGSPLQNLIGETEVALMSKPELGEDRRVLQSHLEELRDIAHAVGNLMTLVSQGRRESGRAVERFDLGSEVDLRISRERAHAQRNGITLEVVHDGALQLEGDREALWLVVSNLVANAIDYTPRGGRVRLELHGGSDSVELSVDDSGPGVPEAERENIFEPFRRGSTRTNRRAGYGLGLSIVKGAVEAQGGTIRVDRSAFGGARFAAKLPRSAPPPPQ